MELERSGLAGYLKFYLMDCGRSVKLFYYKLVPSQLPKIAKNLDLRTQNEKPTKVHKHQKVKPGEDFFSQSFFWLLVILVYSLLCFKNITGEDVQGVSYSSLQRFSSPQAASLFVILAIMMIDRMLYRSNQMASTDNSNRHWADPSFLARHQLTIKLSLHVTLAIGFHVVLGFFIPLVNATTMSSNFSLSLMYLFCMAYLYTSALQVR